MAPSSGFALFNSYAFLLLFLPLTLLAHRLAQRFGGGRAAIATLVLASLVFYGSWAPTGSWSPWFVAGLLASMGVNFQLGRLIARRASEGVRQRGLLTLGVVLNLAALAWFKYANFAALTITGERLGEIILPLAISFVTFQQVAYLVDASRGLAREHDVLDYMLFVSFFPQLIAGPIVHHSEMLPQFRGEGSGGRARSGDLAIGVTLLSFGLFKKVIIADEMASIATPLFNQARDGGDLSTPLAWTAALAYTFQIYFDFSAYSDMATGVARLFGIRLPTNFDSPYKARGIVDFWRRWHITLSRFLRDYLYIPLGGNRKGPARRYANLAITMLLGGLWHGAAWTFVFWGGLHGLYLCVNHAWSRLAKAWRLESMPRWLRAVGGLGAWLLTFICVVVAWVFFRAEGFDAAWSMLASMSAVGEAGWTPPENPRTTALLLGAALVACVALPNGLELVGRFGPTVDWAERGGLERRPWCRWSPDWFWAILSATLLGVAFVHLSRPSEFIYWQF
ncbi:MAG: MBOAT family protein [Planctomycetota bacterium]